MRQLSVMCAPIWRLFRKRKVRREHRRNYMRMLHSFHANSTRIRARPFQLTRTGCVSSTFLFLARVSTIRLLVAIFQIGGRLKSRRCELSSRQAQCNTLSPATPLFPLVLFAAEWSDCPALPMRLSLIVKNVTSRHRRPPVGPPLHVLRPGRARRRQYRIA